MVPLHVSPDGDSVGSALAVASACVQLNVQAEVVSSDPPPEELKFLKGWGGIIQPEDSYGSYDLVLLLDCSSPSRVGRTSDLILTEPRPQVATVDHHRSGQRFGDYLWVEPEAAATAEMLFDWIKNTDIQFNEDIAMALYTGIATDTGFFAYPNTTAETFERAADLVSAGAEPSVVYSKIHEERPASEMKLLGRALNRMQIQDRGRLAWTEIREEDFEICNGTSEGAEGIVNYLRSISGVVVAVVFKETIAGQVKISLRSSEEVDVSELAASLGGGGHARAAGTTLEGSLSSVRRKVLDEIEFSDKPHKEESP